MVMARSNVEIGLLKKTELYSDDQTKMLGREATGDLKKAGICLCINLLSEMAMKRSSSST